jgi:hypothetical protein
MTRQEQFPASVGKLAGIGLAAGGAVLLLVSAWDLYQDLSGQRHLGSPFDVVSYLGLPAAVAVLLFASLRLKTIYKLRLLILWLAVTTSVYAVELFLISSADADISPVMTLAANSSDKRKDAAALSKKFGVDVDIRTPEEVVADLRKAGVDAIPIVTPANHLLINQPNGSMKSAIKIEGRDVIPLAGLSNTLTLLCNENGQWIDYRSDSHGFNNPDEVWYSTRLDVAALGDSFAHGYCVPPAKNFVALIRRRYNDTLNLGMAGNGPLLMLATLKEYLPPFKPKIVLWFYYEGNDLTDLQTERRSALLSNYLVDDFTQSELSKQGDIDRAITAELPRLIATAQENFKRRHSWKALMYRVVAFAKLTEVRERLSLIRRTGPKDTETADDLAGRNMNVFREILSQAKTQVDGWGGQLYFVYLPEWARYTRYSSWGKTSRSEVLMLVNGLGISLIDIEPVFQAQGDPLSLFPFRGVGHYTEAGHRLVAAEVLRRLH